MSRSKNKFCETLSNKGKHSFISQTRKPFQEKPQSDICLGLWLRLEFYISCGKYSGSKGQIYPISGKACLEME